MGFILDVDLETSEGPSHEVYVRIESLTFNKVTMEAGFQLTYWESRDYSNRFNRIYTSEKKKNAVGLIQERVIYFKDEESDGEEVLLPNYMKTPVVKVDKVEVPKYEMQMVEKEVPYVSFDENGDEITKVRKITKEEKVQIGSEFKEVEIYDHNALSNLFDYCYKYAMGEIGKLLPIENIKVEK